jgi:hypothetical protein
MSTANQPKNETRARPLRNLVQITAERNHTREQIEQILDGLDMGGANLSTTIKTLNGIERGSYRISIYNDNEWNEIQVRLKEGPAGRTAIATGYVDKGHTQSSRNQAAQEVRGLVRAYLCR